MLFQVINYFFLMRDIGFCSLILQSLMLFRFLISFFFLVLLFLMRITVIFEVPSALISISQLNTFIVISMLHSALFIFQFKWLSCCNELSLLLILFFLFMPTSLKSTFLQCFFSLFTCAGSLEISLSWHFPTLSAFKLMFFG